MNPSETEAANEAMRNERRHVFDDPRNVRRVQWTLVAACGGLLLADLVVHRHAAYGYEGWFGFYALYGFVACVTLVLLAARLRKRVRRPRDYYEGRDG